jgi:hypothetical protein
MFLYGYAQCLQVWQAQREIELVHVQVVEYKREKQ